LGCWNGVQAGTDVVSAWAAASLAEPAPGAPQRRRPSGLQRRPPAAAAEAVAAARPGDGGRADCSRGPRRRRPSRLQPRRPSRVEQRVPSAADFLLFSV